MRAETKGVLTLRDSRERFWRNAAVYTLISAGGTLGTFALAYRLSTQETASTLRSWLSYHAEIPFFFNVASNAGDSAITFLAASRRAYKKKSSA